MGITIICDDFTPRSGNMTYTTTKYICNLQIVDIYQNIRPPTRHHSKPISSNPITHSDEVVENRSILMGFLMVPIDPQGHREH